MLHPILLLLLLLLLFRLFMLFTPPPGPALPPGPPLLLTLLLFGPPALLLADINGTDALPTMVEEVAEIGGPDWCNGEFRGFATPLIMCGLGPPFLWPGPLPRGLCRGGPIAGLLAGEPPPIGEPIGNEFMGLPSGPPPLVVLIGELPPSCRWPGG